MGPPISAGPLPLTDLTPPLIRGSFVAARAESESIKLKTLINYHSGSQTTESLSLRPGFAG